MSERLRYTGKPVNKIVLQLRDVLCNRWKFVPAASVYHRL